MLNTNNSSIDLMNNDQNYLQTALQEISRVHGLSHNNEIREGYAAWLQILKHKQQQQASDFLALCIEYVESYQCAVRISEFIVHDVDIANSILYFYRDQPQQRSFILNTLDELLAAGSALFSRQHVFQKYVAQGMFGLKELLLKNQVLWDLKQQYHQGEWVFSAPLLAVLDRYIEEYLCCYHGLPYEDWKAQFNALQLEIVKNHPEEIFKLFFYALEHPEYHHYWVDKQLFFVLMEQKDKRLNRPDLLLILLENFHAIIKKMIYAKPFILHLAFSIEKLAKAGQLNHAIVAAMEKIEFVRHSTQSIPMKRLEQIQNKVRDYATEFRQTEVMSEIPMMTYRLPISHRAASQTWGTQYTLSWPEHLQQDFDAMNAADQAAWQKLWQHIDSTQAKKPSKKWLTQAEILFHAGLHQPYLEKVLTWVQLIKRATPGHIRPFDSKNENTFKGLLWLCLLLPLEYQSSRLLSEFIHLGYRKIPGLGATSAVLANVAIYVFVQHGDLGRQTLQNVQQNITYDVGKAAIEKALATATLKPV